MSGCRACGRDDCGCPDPVWQGVIIIDDRSDPGSWAQHITDTEYMRSSRPVASSSDRTPYGSAVSNHGRAALCGEG